MQYKISKQIVYQEVEKLTSYIGKNEEGLKYAYVYTREEDREMLERFWRDACSLLSEAVKPFIEDVKMTSDSDPANYNYATVRNDEVYDLTIALSNNSDEKLNSIIGEIIFSFFSKYITSKWIKISDKEEAKIYEEEADMKLNELKAKIFYKQKPTRK